MKLNALNSEISEINVLKDKKLFHSTWIDIKSTIIKEHSLPKTTNLPSGILIAQALIWTTSKANSGSKETNWIWNYINYINSIKTLNNGLNFKLHTSSQIILFQNEVFIYHDMINEKEKIEMKLNKLKPISKFNINKMN